MRQRAILVIAALSCLFVAATAAAQVTARLIIAGFTRPVAFVQDPSDQSVQVVVEQGGRVRLVKFSQVLPQDYLNLTGIVKDSGEQGLLGLAFAPDYATSGRVYVYFINQAGHTVVSRFTRSTSNPLQADPSTRFDLVWPGGNAYIEQPFANHNGGNMAFGPDGFLYIGLGDGGDGNDPGHRAQNPASLLGKMLRIDVSVDVCDPEGYDIPSTNPFVGNDGVLDEIWAFGLRNPWRWSFDDPAFGGTGAMVIGDVGQGAWEEIDYEPAGAGGRNYGWRNREGAHDNVTSLPLYPGPTGHPIPLVDPILEYSHSVGVSITGGFVYRGNILGPEYKGRYFYADLNGRVWSTMLNVNPTTHEATASDLIEHTESMQFSGRQPSSFGVDYRGEIYILSYALGYLYRLHSARPVVAIETPVSGTSAANPITLSGYAVDLGATSGTGVDTVHLWAHPAFGSPVFVGFATYGASRPAVGSLHGANFTNSGWSITSPDLPPGTWTIYAHLHSTVTNTYRTYSAVTVTVPGLVFGPVLALESPANASSVAGALTVSGYAIDGGSTSGTGVDTVHLWAHPSSGSPVLLGWATYGASRPDVSTYYGASRYQNSGWSLPVNLPPGSWTLSAHLHSTATNSYSQHAFVGVQVTSNVLGPILVVEWPAPGAAVGGRVDLSGYAIDRSAGSGTGVDTIHIWAHPSVGSPVFLGFAAYGANRAEIAGAYGERFRNSGWSLSGNLTPGAWTLAVHLHSTATNTYATYQLIPIQVP